MKKVLIAMPHYSQTCIQGYRALLDYGCQITEIPFDRNYTAQELKEIAWEFDAVIADSEPWCQETLAAAPNLKIIARFGTGMDSVDVEAAKARGVMVTNCPGLNANTVAEQALSLLFSAIRRIPYLHQDTKQGGWSRTMFHQLSQGTVGILGFGNIGQKVAQKLSGFGCKLLAYDLYPNEAAAKALGVTMAPYESVLQESDYISIHMPLLPQTRHCIDHSAFAMVKDTAIMVNTARGALVNEADLYQALTGGALAYYACDVFETEPPSSGLPLFQCDNYIATPHIAGESFENREKTGLATAHALIDVFEGRQPMNRRA